MACRQCTRPSPARVAISRIEKAWLREAKRGSGIITWYYNVRNVITAVLPVADSHSPKSAVADPETLIEGVPILWFMHMCDSMQGRSFSLAIKFIPK